MGSGLSVLGFGVLGFGLGAGLSRRFTPGMSERKTLRKHTEQFLDENTASVDESLRAILSSAPATVTHHLLPVQVCADQVLVIYSSFFYEIKNTHLNSRK